MVFQFHKGTIRTGTSLPLTYDDIGFQFHKGTIRTKRESMMRLRLIDFNSIKVRLELTDKRVQSPRRLPFQFHKGTIRTYHSRQHRKQVLHFNSIKVRLEHLFPSV